MSHSASTGFRPRQYYCSDAKVDACYRGFKSLGGYRQHRNAVHVEPPHPCRPRQHTFSEHDSNTQAPGEEGAYKGSYYTKHPILDGSPCDAAGNTLPADHPPSTANQTVNPDDTWYPFSSRGHFELADFLFRRNQMPAEQVDDLMQVLASFDEQASPPFHSSVHLHETIDAISSGDVPWQSLSLRHSDFEELSLDDPNIAPWKCKEYEVWYRDPHKLLHNQLSNPNFVNNIDYSARQVFGEQGQRVWTDFMTGNWAWNQSVSSIQLHLATTSDWLC